MKPTSAEPSSANLEKKIENIVIELLKDADRGYHHEPRTVQQLLKLFSSVLDDVIWEGGKGKWNATRESQRARKKELFK